MVMINDIGNDTAFSYNIPSLVLGNTNGRELLRYLNKTRNPVARIHKSQVVFDTKAPKVASFSSRGPNTVTGDILKAASLLKNYVYYDEISLAKSN